MSPKLTSTPITFAASVLAGLICLAAAALQVVNIVTNTRVDSEPEIAAAKPSVWSTLPNIKNARFESTAIQYQDDLYVFNGFRKGIKVETTVEKLDAKKLTWSVISNTSIAKGNAVTHNGFVVNGDEVWIIGGRLGDHPGSVTSKVWKFNLQTYGWSAGPELPIPGAAGGAALVDNRIHWFGGLDTKAKCDVDNHYVFDLKKPSAGWSDISSVAPMPMPRNHFATVVLDELIYAIGGQFTHGGCGGGTPDTNLSHVFDPKTNTWDQIDSLPAVQSHIEPSTFVHKGAIYVVGGATNGNTIYRYDPSRDRWEGITQLPQALLAPIARVVNNELIVSSGGAPSIDPSSTTYKTDMTPLLLPDAQDSTDNSEPEPEVEIESETETEAETEAEAEAETVSEPPVTDNDDTMVEESGTSEETTSIDNEGGDIVDTPTEVTPEEDEIVDSSETPQNVSNSTESVTAETDQSTTESDSNTQNDTATNAPMESTAPDSPQSNTNANCDYSNAEINNGWGWDSLSKTSCRPLPVVVTQNESPQPAPNADTTTNEDQTTTSDQVITEPQAPVSDSGGGTSDVWLITLLWSLLAARFLSFSLIRRFCYRSIGINSSSKAI